MTTIFAIAGIDGAANSIGFAPPVSDGLVGWFHIGGTSAASIRNRAENGADAVVAGSPVFSTGYGTFDGPTNRLDTTILDTTAITYLAVAKSSQNFAVSTQRPMIVGAYGAIGAQFWGSCLIVTGTPSAAPAATIAVHGGRDDGASGSLIYSASLTVADFSAWTFLAGSTKAEAAVGGRKIYDKTNGTSATATPATARVAHPSRTVQLGAASSGLIDGTADVAWAAIYNRELSEAEIDKIYAFVKRRLADKYSITI